MAHLERKSNTSRTTEILIAPQAYSFLVQQGRQGTTYVTRIPDGVSGLSINALALMCGVEKEEIQELIESIETGEDWLMTEHLIPLQSINLKFSEFYEPPIVLDTACLGILKHFAGTDEFKVFLNGINIALTNYRQILKCGGLRRFIWEQTGYLSSGYRNFGDNLQCNGCKFGGQK